MSAPAIGPPPLPAQSEPTTVDLPAYNPANYGKGNVHAFDSKDGPSFSDFLDIINPLQHIPIINTIYQHLTGDTQGAVASVVGGALWGGPLGLGCAVADLAVQDATGKTAGDNVLAMITGDDSSTTVAKNDQQDNAKTQTASAIEPPQPAAAPVPQVSATPITPGGSTGFAQTAKADTISPTIPDGPVHAGEYLVFGSTPIAAATGTPITLASAATNPTASTAATAMAAKPSNGVSSGQTQMAAQESGLKRQGDFLVFGEQGAPAATSLPTPSNEDSGASKIANTEHFRPVPARNGPATPQMAIPQPTTGPAAVPGSQVITQASAFNRANSPASDWFANAFSQGMDKYQKETSNGTLTNPSPGALGNSAGSAGSDSLAY